MKRLIRAALVVGLGLVALTAVGCRSTGSYPIEVFSEMHYQPNRLQEPGRWLPPEGAVPVTGALTQSMDPAAAVRVQSPLQDKAAAARVGKVLYDKSCAACHGVNADGNSPVAVRFSQQTQAKHGRPVAPINLRGFAGAPEGSLFAILTNGGPVTLPYNGQPVSVMPSFRRLLTDEQRWQIVAYLKTLQ